LIVLWLPVDAMVEVWKMHTQRYCTVEQSLSLACNTIQASFALPQKGPWGTGIAKLQFSAAATGRAEFTRDIRLRLKLLAQ